MATTVQACTNTETRHVTTDINEMRIATEINDGMAQERPTERLKTSNNEHGTKERRTDTKKTRQGAEGATKKNSEGMGGRNK